MYSICCKEIPEVCNKNVEAVEQHETKEVPICTCITQHPGFQAVSLNRWVLQTAWYQHKQQYEVAYDRPEDRLYRHLHTGSEQDGAGVSWAEK